MKQFVGACAAVGVMLGGAAALAETAGVGLTFDMSASQLAAVQQADQPKQAMPGDQGATKDPGQAGTQASELAKPDFGQIVKKGQERPWFITIGGGVAGDSDPGTHADLFVAWSTFIGTGLEVQFEASGWYFDQDPSNTAGAGFAVNLRWHLFHGSYGGAASDGFDWTVYLDMGIGVIASGDDVPDGGSSFNLAPRGGAGFTARMGDSSVRLVGGVRWHHMSNARFNGDSDNPDFNAPMVYVGFEWPL